MKIVFALPGFHRVDRGAEVALLSVAAELARAGDEVTVLGSGPARGSTPYRYKQLKAARRELFESAPKFPPLRSDTAWEDMTFAYNLVRNEDLRAYQASVTCSFPFTHWALRKHGRAGPANIFVTQNGDWPAANNRAEYRFFRTDGLVCTNPDYLARNESAWRCRLIPNGIDLDRFRPGRGDRQRFGLPATGRLVLMVSALIESKRVLDGIRAVADIQDAFLAVAGDGPLRGEIRKLAEELLPGRFQQLTVPAEAMPDLYRSADAFLHLSLLESFGNVFLEAWATGLPIVGHDSGRLRWILGDDQFLCDTEQPADLANNLRHALSRGRVDRPSGIDRFDWSAIALQYHNFITGVIADD